MNLTLNPTVNPEPTAWCPFIVVLLYLADAAKRTCVPFSREKADTTKPIPQSMP